MKRLVIPATIAITSLLGTPASAQLLNVYEPNGGPMVNGGTITVFGQPTDNIVSRQLPVVLNGADAVEVGVKRYEIGYPAGFTENYFCWYDCWNPDTTGDHPLWYAIDPYLLSPGVQFNGFYADYKPHGVSGVASFLFIWYAVADTTDSVWVYINFDVYEGAGVNEHSASLTLMEIHPNPSLDGAVTVDLDLAARTGREWLVFRDALGREVLRRRVGALESMVAMEAGALPSGIWWVSLESEGRTRATRRMAIVGH